MFKNISMYRINGEMEFAAGYESPQQAMVVRLTNNRFNGRPKHVAQAMGFVTPMEWLRQANGADLAHTAMGATLVAMQVNTVLLPASVIKAALRDRLHEYKCRMGRNPGKKVRNQLKDEVTEHLMLTAFEREQVVRALILWDRNLVLMDSASTKACDMMDDLLGRCGLELQPYTSSGIRGILTGWAREMGGHVPYPFAMGNQFHLTNPADRSVSIRAASHCLDESLVAHIEDGMQVEAAELIYDERIRFRLDSNAVLRGINFDIKPQMQGIEAPDDRMAELDAQMCLYAGEFRELIAALTNEFALS